MSSYETEQEEFWSGDFGNQYIKRNESTNYLASNIAFFASVIKHTGSLDSVLEFGANIGFNLKAINKLLPECKLSGLEINEQAHEELEKLEFVNAKLGSLFEEHDLPMAQLTMAKGVLIHLNPDYLIKAYEALYRSSSKYILIAEYYNPAPVSISYRGHKDKLFKRDFAGEMLDKFKDLKIREYGFLYHRDPNFPQDDITWFLLEK